MTNFWEKQNRKVIEEARREMVRQKWKDRARKMKKDKPAEIKISLILKFNDNTRAAVFNKKFTQLYQDLDFCINFLRSEEIAK